MSLLEVSSRTFPLICCTCLTIRPGLPPCGKTEGVLQIDEIRMRFALIRICSRAALSAICFANASSPKGRAKKLVRTVRLTDQGNSHADLFACCSFRHGLRRATFLKEEGFFILPAAPAWSDTADFCARRSALPPV